MAATTTALLPAGCGVCGKTENLLRCSRCKVMAYCSREHQVAHHTEHKSACSAVGKKRAILDAEEQKLRSHPDNFFKNDVGHFWGIWETRDYMSARFALVEALRKIKTHDAVQQQLDHALDLLRLCRSDNMAECYDFVKWWSTTGNDADYDWGDMKLPYLDIKNADAFEPVEYLCSGFPDLSHLVAITLLKIRLMLDLMALEDPATVNEKYPREIFHATRPSAPRSPIVTGNKDIMERKDQRAFIDKLAEQVDFLYKTVNKANKHFWPSLLNPGSHLTAQPVMFRPGGIEEMQVALQYS
ncbi:hypothetical protein T310_8033 [Rasamsonia emersonii CBS 393.64]|uniref:MYND-type domain-containing protein n=1 Tax=Rasamsonia emersonii (strain ATCC 16479 / CBS 393.64 / IMI 116815) TaxID=1408163 RepID=A0A0F4YIG8_RASE3|nr:hypothetical protein T310_8033 [Rasamsonia emersonii CBS 393.64]KKA18019.1 hypothetical protein T310_8033 [Rasamsonia emersonii CBS 393.64]